MTTENDIGVGLVFPLYMVIGQSVENTYPYVGIRWENGGCCGK